MRGIIYDGTTSQLVEGIQVRDPDRAKSSLKSGQRVFVIATSVT